MNARAAWTLITLLSITCPAIAQEPDDKFERELAQAKAFVPVYSQYLDAINTRGGAGLKKIAASNFVLKWGTRSLSGEKAFAELNRFFAGSPSAAVTGDTVKLRRLTMVGERAIIHTAETCSFHAQSGSVGGVSVTSYWKQTWRKMPQGWRLELWESGTETLPGPQSAYAYTVSWKPKETDAPLETVRAPEKQ